MTPEIAAILATTALGAAMVLTGVLWGRAARKLRNVTVVDAATFAREVRATDSWCCADCERDAMSLADAVTEPTGWPTWRDDFDEWESECAR